jgi:ubiquinone/menaquinone biosynthesis C-methylase UbiE
MPGNSVAFDRAAGYYDATRGFPEGVEKDVAALMARAGSLTPNSRVLEIGVGTGRIALPLAPHVRAYYGIDLARPMMDVLLAKQTNEPITLVQGDVTRLPSADASFDAAVAVHVFHLVPGWRDSLSELARVLRPGAPLIHGWNARHIDSILQEIWAKETEEAREARGAISPVERETFLQENGWREVTPVMEHTYTILRTPNGFLDMIRGRRFSSMWRMSEETLQHGLAAVQAYVDAHYDDPNQPETLPASFKVQAYLPPEG